MTILGRAKLVLNDILAPFNVRVDSQTAERGEQLRLAKLVRQGRFEKPIFPVLPQFGTCDPSPILEAVRRLESRLERFATPTSAYVFSYENSYFESPDAEVLYAMVHIHRPNRIIEVGSGNSTLLFRHAIADAGTETRLISVDPSPRREIAQYADEVIRVNLEDLEFAERFGDIGEGDFLFIDSSHEVMAGNDVVTLYLNIFPMLARGAIVHVHDIFLPYEYPQAWVVLHRWRFAEQYLLQALLQGAKDFEILWAGHYLQRTRPGLMETFKFWRGAAASSVWLHRVGSAEQANREWYLACEKGASSAGEL